MGYSDYVARRRAYRTAHAVLLWFAIAGLVIVLLAIIPYGEIYTLYVRHLRPGIDGKQVVELTGVVTEYPSGKPVEGAFAIVSLHGFRATGYGAGRGGCAVSTALRTDKDGRYRFRWDWLAEGRNIPEALGTELRVYVPGMNYWPRRYWIANIAQFEPNVQISRDDAPFAERLEWLERISRSECILRVVGTGHTDFSRALYGELWHIYCDGEAKPPPLDYETFRRFENQMTGLRERINLSNDSYEARRTEVRKAAGSYPWAPYRIYETPPAPRDFTVEEWHNICTAVHPSTLVKEARS
jgi:hypothetical protein